MAFIITLFCLMCAVTCGLASKELVQLECQSKNGVFSQSTLINCLVKPKDPLATILIVIWKKGESTIFVYQNGKPDPKDPRLQFAEPNWDKKNMNVSLLVTNTQMADEGIYECTVVTDSGEASNTVIVTVIARYAEPEMSSSPEKGIKEEMGVTIFCNTYGGYPKGWISWFDQYNTNWTKSAETDVIETEDKRFDLRSKLTVGRASILSTRYKCIVFNGAGDQEGETEFELPFDKSPEKLKSEGMAVALTAVFVVVGSLVSGVLLLILIQKRRARRSTNMAPIYVTVTEP